MASEHPRFCARVNARFHLGESLTGRIQHDGMIVPLPRDAPVPGTRDRIIIPGPESHIGFVHIADKKSRFPAVFKAIEGGYVASPSVGRVPVQENRITDTHLRDAIRLGILGIEIMANAFPVVFARHSEGEIVSDFSGVAQAECFFRVEVRQVQSAVAQADGLPMQRMDVAQETLAEVGIVREPAVEAA